MKNKFIVFVVSFLLVFAIVSCVNGLGNSSSLSLGGSSLPSDNSSISSSTSSGSLNTDEVAFSALTYCAYGDSIVYGYPPYGISGRLTTPYPLAVKNRLGLLSSTNKGITGGTFVPYSEPDWVHGCITEAVLNCYTKYDIISVMASSNDFAYNAPLGVLTDTTNATVCGALNIVASTLKERFPDSFIFFMTPYKKGGFDSPNRAGYILEELANCVKEIAALYDIPVLDMFNEGNFESTFSSEGGDGLHPDQAFIDEYTAPQIAEFIRENYK